MLTAGKIGIVNKGLISPVFNSEYSMIFGQSFDSFELLKQWHKNNNSLDSAIQWEIFCKEIGEICGIELKAAPKSGC